MWMVWPTEPVSVLATSWPGRSLRTRNRISRMQGLSPEVDAIFGAMALFWEGCSKRVTDLPPAAPQPTIGPTQV